MAAPLFIDAILFDLDGTLVDTVPDLAASTDEMMQELGDPAPGIELVRNWVGNGVRVLVKRALTGDMRAEPDPERLAVALSVFEKRYRSNNGRFARPYPGVRSSLMALRARAMRLGCVTNKPAAFTLPLLAALELEGFFDVVVSGDDVANPKPHPQPLLRAAATLGVAANQTLFVGDSVNDVRAARAANMPVWCVPYGYNHGQHIRDAQPDRIIDELSELPARLFAESAEPGPPR